MLPEPCTFDDRGERVIKKGLLLVLCLFLCDLTAYAVETKTALDSAQITIQIDEIPRGIKHGAMPITLNKTLLSKLLPELSNPRLMTLKDLAEKQDEPNTFMNGGYTFVLKDDFKRDGIVYIAFVGKYDTREDPDRNSFIAIVRVKGTQVRREFFTKIYRDRISLMRVIQYRPKIDAIGMLFNLASDDCGYLFWTGREWQFDLCTPVIP